MSMNILLLGKGGQVGWELQRSLSVLGQVTALDFDSQAHCGDFANPEGVRDTVRQLRPQVIVNAAAHTAVDKAESEPEFARLLNATTPGLVAEEAARLGAWLVHYSTDYVFDGSGTRPWVETDTPAPLSVYGATKLEGEQRIQQSGCQHLILRTSWVYAARGGNFAKTMLRLGQERDTPHRHLTTSGVRPRGPTCSPTSRPTPSVTCSTGRRTAACTTAWRRAKPLGILMRNSCWSTPAKRSKL
jgi:dTDP-4-dehydrorhamnose reductase